MVVVEDLKRRDFIAIEAMKSIIQGCSHMGNVNYDPEVLARSAYKMADEMFAASMNIVSKEDRKPEEVKDEPEEEPERTVKTSSSMGTATVSPLPLLIERREIGDEVRLKLQEKLLSAMAKTATSEAEPAKAAF